MGFTDGQAVGRNGQNGNLSIALAFPNRYYTAMSNLGFQAVYRLFNGQPDTICQRVFLPEAEDLEEHRRTETPLFSLESQRPVRTFDILAFSISYENDYPHLLLMMDLARIPPLKKDRQEGDPLVIAGGATILMNPESLADFVDLFVIGEAESWSLPSRKPCGGGRRRGNPKRPYWPNWRRWKGSTFRSFMMCGITRTERLPPLFPGRVSPAG